MLKAILVCWNGEGERDSQITVPRAWESGERCFGEHEVRLGLCYVVYPCLAAWNLDVNGWVSWGISRSSLLFRCRLLDRLYVVG